MWIDHCYVPRILLCPRVHKGDEVRREGGLGFW